MTDMDELWRDLVRKHTTGGACNFREAAFAFADEAVRNEREACARKADEAESVCTDAALAHPVDSAGRDRCTSRAREASAIASAIRARSAGQDEALRRNHIMSDAVLLRSLARSASNISAVARAQLLAIADDLPPERSRHC